jgi:hypothetical protein
MTDSLKNAANKMAVVCQWEKDEASIASLANHGSADISVGLDSGSIWLLDHNLNQKAEALSDQKFPIIDHFWTQKNQVCYTQGKNIVLFDAEKQKVVTSFIGHTDVCGT